MAEHQGDDASDALSLHSCLLQHDSMQTRDKLVEGDVHMKQGLRRAHDAHMATILTQPARTCKYGELRACICTSNNPWICPLYDNIYVY